ncbi:DUF2487 family protein [Paenibacillus sp. BR2-3]|uniref:DUF2487 family protein n=1 Tax=Paenibacillus sp. BR2-3 TaxID=3048494 RepID=UPI00397757FB
MKFSDFDSMMWEENKQFYDTCLIPFTGLTGAESPVDAVAALERLRDFMDYVEKPFRGRIITYPVFQYTGDLSLQLMNEVCRKVKSINFRYAVVLTADLEIKKEDIIESDLVLSMHQMKSLSHTEIQAILSEKIQTLWQQGVPF